MGTYTVQNMQNNTSGVISELNSAKTKCEKALADVGAQISNIEGSWKGLAADAMLEALSAQKTRIQAVIGRLDSLIAQVKSLSASAAAAWPTDESK